MRILHLSADYPDPLAPAKTRAVSNLLAMATHAEHRVYSLNRIGWRARTRAMAFDDDAGAGHQAVAYGAPPKGVMLRRRLAGLAEWVLDDIAARDFAPDLVHAHKLSVEGLAGARIAAALGKPLMLSVQGNTDLKIVQARADLRGEYRALWRGAAMVFPFAPWAAQALDRTLGARTAPVALLPCPGATDTAMAPQEIGPIFRTAFHLAGARGKNADGLIRAFAAARIPGKRLEIIGGGDPAAFAWIADVIADAPAPAAALIGPQPNDRMPQLFNGACAMPLISHRESFGMVYSEALRAGAPCLIPRDRGIDGYFEEGGVVVAASPRDPAEIAAGLERLAREESAFKRRLAALAQAGGLDFLTRAAIAETYRRGCDEALGRREHTP